MDSNAEIAALPDAPLKVKLRLFGVIVVFLTLIVLIYRSQTDDTGITPSSGSEEGKKKKKK